MENHSAAILHHSGHSEDDGSSVTAPRHEDDPIDLEAAVEWKFAELTSDCNLGGEFCLDRVISAGVDASEA